MDDQGTDREGGANRKAFVRFRLRWLLIAFVPLSMVLAMYFLHTQQLARIKNAYDRMNSVVFDAHYNPDGTLVLFVRNGNLTDSDLRTLIPIGSGEAPMGGHKVIRMELRGSKVTDEAAAEFQRASPACELIR